MMSKYCTDYIMIVSNRDEAASKSCSGCFTLQPIDVLSIVDQQREDRLRWAGRLMRGHKRLLIFIDQSLIQL